MRLSLSHLDRAATVVVESLPHASLVATTTTMVAESGVPEHAAGVVVGETSVGGFRLGLLVENAILVLSSNCRRTASRARCYARLQGPGDYC